jgi:hypothetical protein
MAPVWEQASVNMGGVTDDALPPRISHVSALSKDLYRLASAGYQEVDHPPKEAGEYCLVGQDVAPGWGEYMYDIDVWELPDAPLTELGWRS